MVLDITSNEKKYLFTIQELLPKYCMCLNTDMVVDIVPLDDKMALNVLTKRADQVVELEWTGDGRYFQGSVGQDEYAYFKVYKSSFTVYLIFLKTKIPSFSHFIQVTVTPTKIKDDIDVYCSTKTHKPTYKEHEWRGIQLGQSTCVCLLEKVDSSQYLYFGFHGYSSGSCSPFEVQLNSSRSPFTTDSDSRRETEIDEPITGNGSRCENCGEVVPLKWVTMHSAFCSRNNTRCSACSIVFIKDDFDSHVHCEFCNMVRLGNTKFLCLIYFNIGW